METCVVIARFMMDDVPIFAGGKKECLDYCHHVRKLAAEDREVWQELHNEASEVYGTGIGSACIALWVLRVLPLPITRVAIFGGEEE